MRRIMAREDERHKHRAERIDTTHTPPPLLLATMDEGANRRNVKTDPVLILSD